MKHNFKRFVSAILTISMLLAFSGFAFGAVTASISVGTVTANPEETVEIPVSISGNTGFTDLSLSVEYNSSVLQFSGYDSIADGEISNSGNNLTFSAADRENGITDNGELFTLKFDVVDSAEPGSYAVSLQGSGTDASGAEVPLTFNAGSVTVNEVDTTQYTLTINKVGKGNASTESGVYTYSAGQTVKLVCTQLSGYLFTGWSSDSGITFEDAKSRITSFTMPASNVTVTATFVEESKFEYNITLVQPSAGGTIAINKNSAAKGDDIVLTATPAAGYYFSSWGITGATAQLSDADAAKAYFEMPAGDLSITGTFSPVPERAYAVTLISDKGGHPFTAKKYYSASEVVNLTTTQDDGYYFEGWSCESSDVKFDDSKSDKTYFSMPAHDITIKAEYSYKSKTLYRLTIATEGGGIASTSNTVYEYSAGDTVTISATPSSGYIFYGWSPLSSGVTFTNATSAITTFIMPADNITIKAMFVFSMYGGMASGGSSGGSGGGSSGGNYGAGASGGQNVPDGSYLVSFNTGGGSMVNSQSVVAGNLAVRPADPTYAGYTFEGWYSDYNYTTPFNFSQGIYATTTIYAKWKANATTTPSAGSSATFTDVSSSAWYYDYVMTLYTKGIVNGMGNNKFAPTNSITRAQFVKILAGLAGVNPTSYTTSDFSDVKSSDWFYSCVAWAKATGIAGGSNGKFNPNAQISRQDMAVMIKRYADFKSITLPTSVTASKFADDASISEYAKSSVTAMQQAGIIGGKSGNRFDPKANATRAEACKMIYVLMDIAK